MRGINLDDENLLCICILKINRSKFTRGLDPLIVDACSAKIFEVLPLIFSTDCSPVDWLQSVLKFKRFEDVFLSFFFLKIRRHVRRGEIGLV